VSLLGLAPFAAVVAALGVGLLLNGPGRGLRTLGAVALVAGSLPLVLLRVPTIGETLAAHPLLALVAIFLCGGLLAAGAALFARVPWLVVVLALVASLRIPLSPSNPGPTNHLVILWLVILGGLLAFAWRGRSGDWPAPKLGAVGWALAAFVLFSAVSLFWSAGLEQGAYNFVAFYAPFGALVAMIGSIDVREVLPGALGRTQVTLAALFALVAIYQVATHQLFWNPDLMEANARQEFFRANSLFWDASALGRFEALAIVTVLGVLALGERRRSVPGAAALCAVMFAGLALTYSRAGLAALILGVVVIAAAWRPRVAIPVGIAALVAAIAVLAITGGVSLERITSSRSKIVQQGIELFESAPVAGTGLGSYQSSHSVALGVGAELGLVGLALFVGLVLTVARAAIQPREPGRDRALRVVLAVELLVILAHSMVDAALFDDGIAWALAAMLAVIAVPASSRPPGGAAPPAPVPAAP
jgi:O-antigen ligase